LLTVHHLNNSRCTAVLWLLEGCGTPYNRAFSVQPDMPLRPNCLRCHPLFKSPVITDNGNGHRRSRRDRRIPYDTMARPPAFPPPRPPEGLRSQLLAATQCRGLGDCRASAYIVVTSAEARAGAVARSAVRKVSSQALRGRVSSAAKQAYIAIVMLNSPMLGVSRRRIHRRRYPDEFSARGRRGTRPGGSRDSKAMAFLERIMPRPRISARLKRADRIRVVGERCHSGRCKHRASELEIRGSGAYSPSRNDE